LRWLGRPGSKTLARGGIWPEASKAGLFARFVLRRRAATLFPFVDTGQSSIVLTVGQVAELLQVSRWFVYTHGEELGLVKLGGANRYLRERVEGYVSECATVTPAARAPRNRTTRSLPRRHSRRVPLLDSAGGLDAGMDAP
jgi:hypothetical protein